MRKCGVSESEFSWTKDNIQSSWTRSSVELDYNHAVKKYVKIDIKRNLKNEMKSKKKISVKIKMRKKGEKKFRAASNSWMRKKC